MVAPVARSRTVLFVEDEPLICRLSERILGHYGYVVLLAANGEEAVRVAERFVGPIDLLVTDVIMPGMSGRKLADRLQRKFPDLRVLYTSGYDDGTLLRHGVHRGKTYFLRKPYAPTTLVDKVWEAMDGPPVPALCM